MAGDPRRRQDAHQQRPALVLHPHDRDAERHQGLRRRAAAGRRAGRLPGPRRAQQGSTASGTRPRPASPRSTPAPARPSPSSGRQIAPRAAGGTTRRLATPTSTPPGTWSTPSTSS
ncbi:hypothetical protein G5V59_14025 [Nocardioides sp. W3-2-3]|uniref:hypothetical protein n=1 Tax=Nocardioides convexus TaxID=2712224 RepID=UPI0024182602|nr:hypothetical protein [Nocardioides convexus]NHA00737.1 hypothetical protein [Nocardioides convexus]